MRATKVGSCANSILGQEDADPVFFVSITHLTFDRRLPLAREIAAYQKHRVKRLRRSGPAGGPRAVSLSAPGLLSRINLAW